MDSKKHWDAVYQSKRPDEVSWYRPHLDVSFDLITRTVADRNARIVDVGGGEATLVDDLRRSRAFARAATHALARLHAPLFTRGDERLRRSSPLRGARSCSNLPRRRKESLFGARSARTTFVPISCSFSVSFGGSAQRKDATNPVLEDRDLEVEEEA